jgi:Zn-dependent M16 (insulinase) family peptidase
MQSLHDSSNRRAEPRTPYSTVQQGTDMTTTFELVRTQRIDTLNVEMQEYRHSRTGAVHYHLAAEDSNNCFMVAFPTVPMDHTGVAHILEHTVLCGSRKYPVRDPFFMMLRRSLNTFMNAFTSSDATAYPFATQNRKDFENLLSVYLDAVFFPKLDPLDFAQEGHRIEFAKPADPSSPLMYRGVVYNEMKGAMSSPIAQVQMELQSLLFPTTTYHYNSGGDPEHIPSLSYEQLASFHRSHYHPSNATFMTYGDFPVRDTQALIEDWALEHFEARTLDLHLHDERRYREPLRVESYYTHEGTGEERDATYIAIGWLLGRTGDSRHYMHDLLLSNVLLQHSGSPLRRALETTSLGTAPLELCGLDDSAREAMFICGLEGSNAGDADAVERLVFDVLEGVARDGVPQETIEAVLTQLEIAQRELGGGHFPHGLQLLTRILGAKTHGGDPFAFLDVDAAIEELRTEIKNPDFIKRQVRRLLDNPHRVRLVMSPDPGLAKRRELAERRRLDALAQEMDAARQKAIVERASTLDERQRHGNNPDLLPKVGIADVPPDLRIPVGREQPIAGTPATWYSAGTNGLVYMQWVAELPALTTEETEALVLYYTMLPEVGSGGRDYAATQALQARLGSLAAHVSLRADVADVRNARGFIALSGKSLARDQAALARLMRETIDTVDFGERQRVREVVAQMRAGQESSVTDRGHTLAMLAAASGMGTVGQLDNLWDGPLSIAKLKRLDTLLDDDSALADFVARLRSIREKMTAQAPRLLVVSQESEQHALEKTLAATLADGNAGRRSSRFAWSGAPQRVHEAWLTNTQVSFCARAYPAVPADHPDAPVFSVLGKFLHNGYLHRAIREQGGAYGSGARYDSDSGSFRFFSYRDPRLEGTLHDFDEALDWLQGAHIDRELEEAVLGIIQAIDQPASPAGEAIQAYFQALHGRTPEFRRRYRSGVLATTIADLQRVGREYLRPELASTAVITNRETLDKHAHLRLEPRTI